MGTKKAVKYSPGMRDWLANLPEGERSRWYGIAGQQRLDDDVPGFILTEAEGPITKGSLQKGNAFVILGVDRNGTPLHGYGGKGHTHCGSIDIVAGRMGINAAKSVTANWAAPGKPDDETTENIYIDPDFKRDAARIYISQKSDVDTYFGLAAGKVGNTKFDEAQSCVAIKADAIRVIGRQGIKLISGGDTHNSQGGKIEGHYAGIDLIAGNICSEPKFDNTNSLQPLVKGDNLVDTLKRIFEELINLRKFIDTFSTYQQNFNSVVMNHQHHSNWPGLISSPSPPLTAMGVKNMIDVLTNVTVGVTQNKVTLEMTRADRLEPSGPKYINSKWNNTN